MNLSIYRICLQGLVLAALAVGTSSAVRAQGYPDKPITIKVAFPACGPADVSIRAANIVVCTENFIRVDDVMESPKLAE